MLTYASKAYVNVDNEINFNIMPMGSFAMHAFDAAPARGKRHLIMSVEKGDTDNVCDILHQDVYIASKLNLLMPHHRSKAVSRTYCLPFTFSEFLA